MAKKNDKSAASQRMAEFLNKTGSMRPTGKCCICYKTISNGAAAEAHYAVHS